MGSKKTHKPNGAPNSEGGLEYVVGKPESPRINVLTGRSRAESDSRNGGTNSIDLHMAELDRYPIMSREQEIYYGRRAQAGDEKAVGMLAAANLRFVMSYVKRYQNRGLDYEELVSLGNEGLLKAARKFDPDKGVKFISYAVWWIRQSILEYFSKQGGSFHIPLNVTNGANRVNRQIREKENRGKEVSELEIKKMVADEPGLSWETWNLWLRSTAGEVRLDAPQKKSEPNGRSRAEAVYDIHVVDPEAETEELLMRERVHAVVETSDLTQREKIILGLYYGLDDQEPMTLEEIGSLLGVTRERIRQVRNKSFDKLRADGRLEDLI